MSEDFYEILGVSRDASEDDIKQAYRAKASEYHPDVSDDPDAEEKFKKLQKAKEVLTDEEKRQMYDQLGHERFEQAEKHGGFDGGAGGGAGGPFGGGAGGPFGGGGGGPFGGQDPFGGGGGGGGGVGDIFEQIFGGGSGGRDGGRGADLRTTLELDLEEAYEGAQKQVTVRRPETCDACRGEGHPPGSDARTCPECEGRGQVTRVQQTPLGRMQQTQTCRRCSGEGELYEETCDECGGEGQVTTTSTLTVEIPAGIEDGQTLRMENEGAPGETRRRNGDLLIEVSVADHPDFERDGDDLQHRVPISFPQATFGDTVEVPTLDGSVEMDVPAGTQSGETFRLENKGMPRLRGRGQGDLYVQVQVVTPDSLNEEQREALEQFAEAGGEEIEVEKGFFEKIKSTF